MKIAFVVPTEITFNHFTWAQAPCAGSELAVIHTAKAIASVTDFDVFVLTHSAEVGNWEGVTYQNINMIDRICPDACVYVRAYNYKSELHPEKRNILWLQDTWSEIAHLTKGTFDASCWDGMVFVSHWQKEQILGKIKPVNPPFSVAPPPLPTVNFASSRRRNRIIHSAHPRKSLHQVLSSFRLIVDLLPDVELFVCGHPGIYQEESFIYQGNKTTVSDVLSQESKKVRERICLSETSLSQKELIYELSQSEIFFHPDTSIETGATTVVEAMYAGAVPIVSSLGCLPELCWEAGYVVSADFRRRTEIYAHAVVDILTDDERRADYRNSAMAKCACRASSVQVAKPFLDIIHSKVDNELSYSGHGFNVSSAQHVGVEIVEYDSVSVEKKNRFILASNASSAHLQAWRDNVEGGVNDFTVNWKVVLFENEIVALVPAAVSNDHLVSGIMEPSGPLIASGLTYLAAQKAMEAALQAILDAGAEHACKTTEIRFSIGGHSGVSHSSFYFAPLLYDFGFRYTWMCAYALKRDFVSSGRIQEYLSKPRPISRISEPSSDCELEVVLDMYQKHCAKKQLVSVAPEKLLYLYKSCGLGFRAFILWRELTPVAFALCTRHGNYSSIWSWGSVVKPLAGEMHYFIGSISRCLLRCSSFVDLGTVECSDGSLSGISEFYRRMGATHKKYLIASWSQHSNSEGQYRVV